MIVSLYPSQFYLSHQNSDSTEGIIFLPVELIIKIFNELRLADIGNLQKVCKYFCQIVKVNKSLILRASLYNEICTLMEKTSNSQKKQLNEEFEKVQEAICESKRPRIYQEPRLTRRQFEELESQLIKIKEACLEDKDSENIDLELWNNSFKLITTVFKHKVQVGDLSITKKEALQQYKDGDPELAKTWRSRALYEVVKKEIETDFDEAVKTVEVIGQEEFKDFSLLFTNGNYRALATYDLFVKEFSLFFYGQRTSELSTNVKYQNAKTRAFAIEGQEQRDRAFMQLVDVELMENAPITKEILEGISDPFHYHYCLRQIILKQAEKDVDAALRSVKEQLQIEGPSSYFTVVYDILKTLKEKNIEKAQAAYKGLKEENFTEEDWDKIVKLVTVNRKPEEDLLKERMQAIKDNLKACLYKDRYLNSYKQIARKDRNIGGITEALRQATVHTADATLEQRIRTFFAVYQIISSE